jgi:hypothetical protein
MIKMILAYFINYYGDIQKLKDEGSVGKCKIVNNQIHFINYYGTDNEIHQLNGFIGKSKIIEGFIADNIDLAKEIAKFVKNSIKYQFDKLTDDINNLQQNNTDKIFSDKLIPHFNEVQIFKQKEENNQNEKN